MSALKDQDPDYGPSDESSEKHQRIYEENARTSTARKITSIIEREFSEEINAKEKEVLEIQERLHRASKILHLLRYVIVSDFYNRKQCQSTQNGEARQTQIHPAIKQLIGKAPRLSDNNQASGNENRFGTESDCKSTIDGDTIKTEKLEETVESQAEKRINETDDEPRPKKIPRYIPPKSGVPESQYPSRGIRHKVRKRIIVGNISKWIPPEWREDAASHKWTMYVRGNKENPDIDDFVSKVRFFLHPSYRPNDVVEVTAAPFCLSRRGWGEFPVRVQLHFQSALNKPMDIIHHLKLDRTYTGLQTLGSETLVDIWIYADSQNLKRNLDKLIDQDSNDNETDCKVKVENSERNVVDVRPDLNETVEATRSCDVVIKREPSEDRKIEDENIQRLRFFVELDHDYCSSKYLNSEKNLTIDHSTSINVSGNGEKKGVAGNNNSPINRDSSNLKIGEMIDESELSPIELNRNTSRIPPVSWSKVYTNLRPLEITIPPVFEPSGSKHVLVLKNNKTIPVNDITAPRKEDHARNTADDPIKLRTSVTTCRGVSLLKKPLGSESTISVRNSNEKKSQQGAKLQLSKSVILNMNSNIPVLKIADRNSTNGLLNSEKVSASEQALKIYNRGSKEPSKVSRQKITIGKDKHKLQSKKEFYDEALRAIEDANISDVQGLLRFIIRRMPMVTQHALDPDYRQLHPYACATEQEFLDYTVAKRSACEWSRSRMIQGFLKKKIVEQDLWTIKEIMIWARLHGYTPLCRDFTFQTIKQQKSLPDSTVKTISTCTEPDAFSKWLQVHPGRSNDCSERDSRDEPNVEIDVVNIDASLGKNKGLKKQNEGMQLANTKTTVLEFESRLMPLYDFVCETARDIGVRLVPEEIAPSVVHCAASRMIMRAVECLVEDLVRISLTKAWERATDDGYPKMIVLDDVRGALLSREEFDIFTNHGLGTKSASMD